MPQIKGTNVVAPVVPLDTADVHPSHEARYGKGGYRTVATLAERDAISAPRREAGMLVYVQADDKIYQLSADLLAWEEFSGGVSTWTELEGKPSTFPPEPHGHTASAIVGLQAALDGKQAAGSYVLTTDARLSDARQPLTHTHTASQITDFTSAVIAAAPPTADASLLTQGTLPDARLSSAIARTSDVSAAVAAVVGAAPESLNTLQELSSALANDASFSATVTNSLASKAPLANPTFTGTVSGITAAMVGLGNVANVDARARSSHTGTQAISTVSGLQAALDAKASLSGADFTGAVDVNGVLSADTVVAGLVETSAVRFPSGHDIAHNSGAVSVRQGTGAYQAIVLANDSRLSDARTPTAHTQAWSTITATPTTLSGYGITDAVASSDARLTDARTPLAHNQAWSTITSTPTTLAGYGITDAAGVSHTHSASQVTDFASAVAAAAPPEVLDFLTTAQFPATGSASKIYVATDPSRAYQWTGSQYAEIGPAGAFLPVHSHAASDITSGVLATARLGSGATATNFLRGDSTYADPVTYATTAQAQAATSTTTAMSPSRTQDSLLAHAQVFPNWLNSASGGASSGAGGGFGIGLVMSLQSSTTPNGTAVLYTSGGLNNLQGLWSQGNVAGQGWTRRRILRVRVARHNTASPSANMVMRVVWGRNAITFGALNAAGVSFEVRQSRIWLVTHNGTSATETDSGADFLNNECHDFILDSNGTGGCTLFRNGVQIATNTGAPTADSTGWCSLHYQVGNGGDSTNCIYSFGPSTLSYS